MEVTCSCRLEYHLVGCSRKVTGFNILIVNTSLWVIGEAVSDVLISNPNQNQNPVSGKSNANPAESEFRSHRKKMFECLNSRLARDSIWG